MPATFEGRASVADLWASLPGLPASRRLLGDRPRSLTLEPMRVEDGRPLYARIAAPTHAAIRFTRVVHEELPMIYPATRGLLQDGMRHGVFGTDDPVFKFPREGEDSPRPLHEAVLLRRPLRRPGRATEDRGWRGRAAIGVPDVLGAPVLPSELARYYPDTWVAALDLTAQPQQSRWSSASTSPSSARRA